MKQYLDAIKKFRPIDDTFMRILFRKNTSLVQRILNIILEKKDIEIERLETQLDLIKSHDSKSIRPDVLAIDQNKNYYDIEIQRDSKEASSKRYIFLL